MKSKKIKKGFTLIEILSIIILLSVLLVLIIPNITELSSHSKISLRDSKIQTLVTAGEKYGNSNINKYQNCDSNSSLVQLKDECSVPVESLVEKGYMTADENDIIIDPQTNQPLDGRVLLCYNPSDISIYARYAEKDEDFYCDAIDLNTGVSLSLSSIAGTGYVNGSPIEVHVIKSGLFSNFKCTSSDKNLATCNLDNTSKLVINVTANDFTEPSKEVKITVTGTHAEGTLTQDYTLVIYSPKLSVNLGDYTNECLRTGENIQVGVSGTDIGKLSVSSSNENILSGSINKSILNISGKSSTGLASLKIKEDNGNKEATVTKRVYKLAVDGEFPEGLLLGNERTIQLNYGGNESVTVETDSPEVVTLFTDTTNQTNKVTLNGTREFKLKALKTGTAKITITGNPCGKLEYTIEVSNLYTKAHEANLYIGGNSFSTEIVSAAGDTYTCNSSSPSIVTCSIKGTRITLTPGSNPSPEEGVNVAVYGKNGGYDIIKANVTSTNLNVEDEDGYLITKVYSDADGNSNMINGKESSINIKGTNAGDVTIDKIEQDLLVFANINKNHLEVNKRPLNADELKENYQVGINTGISKITLKESNGNKIASFDYQIYNFKLENTQESVLVTEEKRIKVTSFATGNIRATTANPDIATVKVENPISYNYGVNAPNESYLTIKGLSVGKTSIIITGEDCGERIIEVEVKEQTFYINTLPGTYTTSISKDQVTETERLTCSTGGSATSCTVTFPSIYTSSLFRPVGFSLTKDSIDAEYFEGDSLVLTKENSGKTYYGNSVDETPPVCSIDNEKLNLSANKTDYIDILCIEQGSGLEDDTLSMDDFVLSDSKVINIESISDASEVVDGEGNLAGYRYRVGVRGKSVGNYSLSLKEGAVSDKFKNKNSEIHLISGFASEFKSIEHWYVGKENEKDIIAYLYDSEDYGSEPYNGSAEDEEPENYVLVLEGTGDIKDFEDDTTEGSDKTPPWLSYQLSVKNVIIKEGITGVGKFAFWCMYALHNVELPEGITVIEEGAFSFTDLYTLKFPSTVKETKIDSFFDNNNLKTLELNEGLVTIGHFSFRDSALADVEIPSTVETIGQYAFANKSSDMTIKNLTFAPDSHLTAIHANAFKNHQLESVTFPKSLLVIGDEAFAVEDPQTSTLRSISFEENSRFSSVEKGGFFNNKLIYIDLPDSIQMLRSYAFYGMGMESFEIGPNVKEIAPNFIAGENLRAINVSTENSNYISIDGVLYNIYLGTYNVLMKCPEKYYLDHSELNVPDGVQHLDFYSFAGWENSLVDGDIDFKINLPSSVNAMNEDRNFDNFLASEINIDSPNYKSVDGALYSGDLKTAIWLPTKYKTSEYTIPDGVTTVGKSFAYLNSSVRTITVPESVTKIEDYAFASDPTYGMNKIYLNTSSTSFTNQSFNIMILGNNVREDKLSIYVKSQELKDSIEEQYASLIEHSVLSVELN